MAGWSPCRVFSAARSGAAMRTMTSGPTVAGEDATREIWDCGARAFVVLEALAFDLRGENEDAYDLF